MEPVHCSIVTAICLLVTLAFGVAPSRAEGRAWSRSEVLAAADATAREHGYDVERMSVSLDRDNSHWQQHLQDGGHSQKLIEGRWVIEDLELAPAELTGHAFWAVRYAPLEGDSRQQFWVFLDRQTGEVLTTVERAP